MFSKRYCLWTPLVNKWSECDLGKTNHSTLLVAFRRGKLSKYLRRVAESVNSKFSPFPQTNWGKIEYFSLYLRLSLGRWPIIRLKVELLCFCYFTIIVVFEVRTEMISLWSTRPLHFTFVHLCILGILPFWSTRPLHFTWVLFDGSWDAGVNPRHYAVIKYNS